MSNQRQWSDYFANPASGRCVVGGDCVKGGSGADNEADAGRRTEFQLPTQVTVERKCPARTRIRMSAFSPLALEDSGQLRSFSGTPLCARLHSRSDEGKNNSVGLIRRKIRDLKAPAQAVLLRKHPSRKFSPTQNWLRPACVHSRGHDLPCIVASRNASKKGCACLSKHRRSGRGGNSCS